jgi:hypothetical protein
MLQSFMAGSKPDCQEIVMDVIDTYNNKSTESHFVTLVDIRNMDPCSFTDKRNPVTNIKCQTGFTNMKEELSGSCIMPKIPDDFIAQAYFVSLGGLSIYITYRYMVKMGLVPAIKF